MESSKATELPPTARRWVVIIALAVVLAVQVRQLPSRVRWVDHVVDAGRHVRLTWSMNGLVLGELAPLLLVADHSSPDAVILLLTDGPTTDGDSAYQLYHTALYRLYPRRVWWARPTAPVRRPTWWAGSDLSADEVAGLVERFGATAVLADGVPLPQLPGSVIELGDDMELLLVPAAP